MKNGIGYIYILYVYLDCAFSNAFELSDETLLAQDNKRVHDFRWLLEDALQISLQVDNSFT